MDDILHREPRYTEMDFVTRDTYRHAIEDLSRGSGFSEIDVTDTSSGPRQAGGG